MNISKEQLERLSRVWIEDRIVDALIESGHSLRTSELSKALGETTNVATGLLREVLESSQRIEIAARRWDLPFRRIGASRPLEGLIGDVLRIAGRPMALEALVGEAAAVYRRSREDLKGTLGKVLSKRSKYSAVAENVFALDEWLLDVSDVEEEEDILFKNYIEPEESEACLNRVNPSDIVGSAAPGDWCYALVSAVGHPVKHRLVAFLLWRAAPERVDGATVLKTLWRDERLLLLSTGECLTRDMEQVLLGDLVRQSHALEHTGTEAEEVDIQALLEQPLEKEAEVQLTETELRDLNELAQRSVTPLRLSDLLGDVFELRPSDPEYVPALKALVKHLDQSLDFQRVGLEQWQLKSQVPDLVHDIPTPLRIERVDVRTIEDEEVDAELTDDGLEADLAAQVRAPEWEDVEEDEVLRIPEEVMTKDRLSCTILYHHYLAGTMKLRSMDEDFFGSAAVVTRAVFETEAGEVYPVWISRDTRLIYGLQDFYRKHFSPSGSTFHLTRSRRPDRYLLSFEGERHPLAYVERSRIEELKALGEHTRANQMSLLEMMQQVMAHHPKGVDFLTLVAEINVARRTTKRLIASNLSAYPCFYEKKTTVQPWGYDSRKADQARMKVKRKYIRKR